MSNWYHNIKLKWRLVLGFTLIVLCLLIGIGLAADHLMSIRLANRAKENLQSITKSTMSNFKGVYTASIKNYLRAVADHNKQIVEYYYAEYKAGRTTEENARKTAAKILLNQRISTDGYIYCINSKGILIVHPFLKNKNISRFSFVQEQIQRKDGYLDYMWKNPDDENERPKALSMTYFEPWDWIISASYYKYSFSTLVDIKKFKKEILTLKMGQSGYGFVLDMMGNVLLHPDEGYGSNLSHKKDQQGRFFIQEILKAKNNHGFQEYYLKQLPSNEEKPMLVYYEKLKELNLLVVFGIFKDEIYEPINLFEKYLIIIGVLILLLFVVPVVHYFSLSITKPIIELANGAEKITRGNFNIKLDYKADNELGFLCHTFETMSQEIQKYNERLEDLVEERTKELQGAYKALEEAFEKLYALKVQQDGDYFLISLLVNPLMTNIVKSDQIDLEVYLRQQKQFSYKEWKGELGGDICIANSIDLISNITKNYTVFVNGDAMGKSIQGIGGALVLGVVFQAFVSRTKKVLDYARLRPEEWLSRCIEEIQQIFFTFDCSMLVSSVIGIIDEENGLLYYYNAGHPEIVLYRNNKAGFINPDVVNSKFGTTFDIKKIQIESIQLQPDDVIIVGSDGREEYLTGFDDDGSRIINEDETVFPHFVEKAKGETKSIVQCIAESGELVDDLSLIRIAYKSTQP